MISRTNQAFTCAICHKPFDEYGHHAMPVATGRACNACNDTVVIPARLKRRHHEDDRGQAGNRTAAQIGSRR
jgi:hypothetical protein